MREMSVEELRLSLLGQVAIRKNGVPVTGFKSSKTLALLCYLAVTRQSHFRSLWQPCYGVNCLKRMLT